MYVCVVMTCVCLFQTWKGVIWNSSVARFGCGSLTRGGRAPSQRVLYHSYIHVLHTYIKCTYRRGAGLGRALAVAGVKALVTLSAMSIIGYTYIHTYCTYIHTF